MQERRPLDRVPVLLKLHTMLADRLLRPLLALIQYLWKTKGDKGEQHCGKEAFRLTSSQGIKELRGGTKEKKIRRLRI